MTGMSFAAVAGLGLACGEDDATTDPTTANSSSGQGGDSASSTQMAASTSSINVAVGVGGSGGGDVGGAHAGGDNAGGDADGGAGGAGGGGCIVAPPAQNPGTISLASTMSGTGKFVEYDITGSLAQIDFGNGQAGDADGLYNPMNPAMMFGSGLDLFPNETAFQVGSVAYDPNLVCTTGTQTVPIDTLDLTGLWQASSATTDINDVALGLWFFAPNTVSLSFGALDASDTITFVDGSPTSIDVSVVAMAVIDYSSGQHAPATHTGQFSVAGDTLSLNIDETVTVTVDLGFGAQTTQTRLEINLPGDVDAIP
ncbi:MAG: hypothetical protein AAGN82_28360 [Myxococcota bacterium]